MPTILMQHERKSSLRVDSRRSAMPRARRSRKRLSFLSRDLANSDLNLYRYCHDNPVIFVDPSGLRSPAGKFEYVPGVLINDFNPSITKSEDYPGKPAAIVTQIFRFKKDPAPSPGMCPLCTKLGVVQIATQDYSVYEFGVIPITFHKTIYPDGGFPYHNLSINPSNTGPGVNDLNYRDQPGYSDVRDYFLYTFSQHTEMHLMCIEGVEKGAVYGGGTWDVVFTYDSAAGRYILVGNSTAKNDPSGTFKTVVDKYLQ